MVILCCGGEKRRLRCLGNLPGVVCFAAFAGDAFAVQPGFGNQGERVRRESEFMLRDRQAASVSFHGVRRKNSQEREVMKNCRCR